MTDEEIKARYQSGNSRRWTGIMLLIVGGLLLGEHAGFPVPHWIFSWEMILIVVGCISGIQHRFHGIGWLILIFIGSYFLVADNYPGIDLHQYTWPIILIGIGLIFVLKPHRKKWNYAIGQKDDPNNIKYWKEAYKDKYTYGEDYIDIVCIFGGQKKNIFSKDFQGGEVTNLFGGTELNLSQADITKRITIEITQVCGGTKLIVPPHWEVRTEFISLFSGVEDKRPLDAGTLDPNKVLILKGVSIFGGIEIRSY